VRQSPQISEKRADIIDEELRLLKCAEMAASRHEGEALQVVLSLVPEPGRESDIFGPRNTG
jgi:hypothetical protein